MANTNVFAPNPQGTVSRTVSSSSASVQLNGVGDGATILVTNIGSEIAYIEFGNSTITATAATGVPILAGSQIPLNVGQPTHVAAITASGTTTLKFTTGHGF